MEMFYQTNGLRSFIDVCLGPSEEIIIAQKTYMIRMLENNKIPYLIKPVSGEIDGNVWLKYNVDTKCNLRQFFKQKKPDSGFVMRFIQQINKCVSELEKYLLTPGDIVLDPEYVLYDDKKQEIGLVYVPGYKRELKAQLGLLFEFMLVNFEHRDKQGIETMYEAYDMVNCREFEISSLGNFIVKYEKNIDGLQCKEFEVCNEKISIPKNHNEIINDKSIDLDLESAYIKENNATGKTIKTFIKLIFSGILLVAGVLFENGLFYILGAIVLLLMTIFDMTKPTKTNEDNIDLAMQEYEVSEDVENVYGMKRIQEEIVNGDGVHDNIGVSKMIPLSNGMLSEIDLDGTWETIVVGRGRKNADYVLASNQISRVHASITRRNNQIFVRDRSSANGTFVNSERLTELQEYAIKPGDIVAFANEEFYVQ